MQAMEQALLLSNSAQAAGSLGAGGNGERHAAPAGRQRITLSCTPGWMQRLAAARTAATLRGSRRARSYREQGGAAGGLAVVAVLVFLACGALVACHGEGSAIKGLRGRRSLFASEDASEGRRFDFYIPAMDNPAGPRAVADTAAADGVAQQRPPVDLLAALDWSLVKSVLHLSAQVNPGGQPAEHADVCAVLAPEAAGSVAIVGNGPLSADDHRNIAKHDWVVRFNYLDNFLPGERVDVWVGRSDLLEHSHWARRHSYYPSDAPFTAAAAAHHVILGSGASFAPEVLQKFRLPPETVRKALLVNTTAFIAAYLDSPVGRGQRQSVLTSGFMVALAAAACASGQGKWIHLFGANWSRLQLPMVHHSERELLLATALADAGLLTQHPPPCGGHDGSADHLRHCGPVDHALCREATRNCEQVPKAMLADMFSGLSFPRLLEATRDADPLPAGETSETRYLRRAAALTSVWEGPAAVRKAQSSRYCQPFLGAGSAEQGGKSIAIVGNGPLSDAQRGSIAGFDVVLRFNYLNNRLPGEKMDVWVACFGWELNGGMYWGFSQGTRSETLEALATNATVVLFGGFSASSALPLLGRFPDLSIDKVLYLDLAYSDEQFYSGYRAVFGKDSGKFLTTGFRVTLATLACQAEGSEVHLFGFNWSPKFWDGHDTAVERRVLLALADAGQLQVHMPPCDGIRRCGEHRDIHGFNVRETDGFEAVLMPANRSTT